MNGTSSSICFLHDDFIKEKTIMIILAPVVIGLTIKAIVAIVTASAVGGGAVAGVAAYGVHRYRTSRENNLQVQMAEISEESHRRSADREDSMNQTEARVSSSSESLLGQCASTQTDLANEVQRLKKTNAELETEVKRLTALLDSVVKSSEKDKIKLDELTTQLEDKIKGLDKTTKDFSESQARLAVVEDELAESIGEVATLKFTIEQTRKELTVAKVMIQHYTDKKDETEFTKKRLEHYKTSYEKATDEIKALTEKMGTYQQKTTQTLKRYETIIKGYESQEPAETSSAPKPNFFN